MASSLRINMTWSRHACKHTLQKLNKGAANFDQWREPGAPNNFERCVKGKGGPSCARLMNEVDKCVYDHVRPTINAKKQTLPKLLDRIRLTANTAGRHGCGNCAEFALVAFVFLYDNGVTALDWIKAPPPVDHNWLLIGREGGDPTDFKPWGSKAAICEPWGEGFRGNTMFGTYPASMYQEVMGKVLGRGALSQLQAPYEHA